MKPEEKLNEVLWLTNRAATNPQLRVKVMGELASIIRSLALWPPVFVEQLVEAEKTFWAKNTDLMPAVEAVMGDKLKGSIECRDQIFKLLELFVSRIRPAIIESMREAGYTTPSLEESIAMLSDEDWDEIKKEVGDRIKEKKKEG